MKVFNSCMAGICAALLSAEGLAAALYPAEIGSDLTRRYEGGFVLEPNTGKGEILIVNRQDKVSTNEFIKVFEKACADVYHFEFRIAEQPEDGKVMIEVRAGDGQEQLTVYPDSCRAIVDVTALAKDNPKPKRLAERTRKEMLRAFIYLVGGASFPDPQGTLADAIISLDRLDAAKEAVPPDLPMRFPDFCERLGIKPWFRITYQEACERGIAEKPCNAEQEAIWEKVHAIPTKPLKIEYDPALQKGKVTK